MRPTTLTTTPSRHSRLFAVLSACSVTSVVPRLFAEASNDGENVFQSAAEIRGYLPAKIAVADRPSAREP